MKILLDHNIPHELRARFPQEHEVFTAQYLGWSDYDDHELLRAAVERTFSVFVTLDRNLAHQQELKAHDMGVIVLAFPPATSSHLSRRTSRILDVLPRVASEREVVVLE